MIIAKPKRVTVLAKILRQELVQNQRLRVSEEDRKQKTDALYSYIISPSFNQHLDLLDDLASKLRELGTSEEAAHRRLWKKREALIKSMQEAQGDLRADFDQIIGAGDAA